MSSITHNQQRDLWEAEHANPYVLPAMDSADPSSGVIHFWEWLYPQLRTTVTGIELGCGKGRNCIWLAEQGAEMEGLDFSPTAIEEAEQRAIEAGADERAHFSLHDATEPWPYDSDTFDFGIDCFASTDIESYAGRAFARDELLRVLKPGGYLFVYSLSTDDEFHLAMVAESPADEPGSFLHPTTGKFEKIFTEAELHEFYQDLTLITEERIAKSTTFFGKDYQNLHFWLIFQKKRPSERSNTEGQ